MGIGALRRRYNAPAVAEKTAPKVVEKPKVEEVVVDEQVVEEKPKAAPKTAK